MRSTQPVDWRYPEWPAPRRVRALWSPRGGGVSLPPYDSLNLAVHVGDSADRVESNRKLLHKMVGARPVYLSQLHGTDIVELQSKTADGVASDGAYTGCTGIACVVMAADCLPILLCNRAGSQVAALHAGWRGLAGVEGTGILEVFHRQIMLATHAGCAQAATDWIAWLGPCIGPLAFEVGAEVRSQFVEHQRGAAQAFAPFTTDKFLANLPLLARSRLRRLGVQEVYGNDGSLPWCTVSNPSHFFSYRRDGVTGRHAACIWLE